MGSKLLGLLIASAIFLPSAAYADRKKLILDPFVDHVRILSEFGDGKAPRPYGKWVKQVKERPVEKVIIQLRRTHGDHSTYVNLRFKGGQTFENGKRVYLKDDKLTTITWHVGGTWPKKKPLVLNVYNGAVFMRTAMIRYTRPEKRNDPRLQPRPTIGGIQPGAGGHGHNHGNGHNHGSGHPVQNYNEEDTVARRCLNIRRPRPPRIEIASIRASGGIFSGKFRVEGSVYGMCVEEAAYFEEGELKERIEIPYLDRYKRNEFKLRVRSGRKGQLRVLTSDGSEDVIEVDRLIKKKTR